MADSAGDQAGDRAGAGDATGDGTEDEVKRRFREALERKRGASADKGAGGGGKSSSKVRGKHARADHQRQFRRKSG